MASNLEPPSSTGRRPHAPNPFRHEMALAVWIVFAALLVFLAVAVYCLAAWRPPAAQFIPFGSCSLRSGELWEAGEVQS